MVHQRLSVNFYFLPLLGLFLFTFLNSSDIRFRINLYHAFCNVMQVKAMELIDQLEVTRRGPYSGGFGGVSFSGDMDIALALRTMVFPTASRFDTMYSYKDDKCRREWVAYLQAGAGIVADSDPDDEHQECQNKAAGLARAIDLAEAAFLNE